jgi:hypothetical protein
VAFKTSLQTRYNALVALIHMLRHQSADTTFPGRVADLIKTRSAANQRAMGFPDNRKHGPAGRLMDKVEYRFVPPPTPPISLYDPILPPITARHHAV